MQLHVMEAAEQDSAVDVGAPVAASPFVDVVSLAEGRGAVAADPSAPAVADRECDALLRGEQPVLPTDVERVPSGVDRDGYGSGIA